MYMKGVYVLNAQFLLTCQHIHVLRFVGCNYGHVKAADESQSISFCFKYYGGWIRGPDPQSQLLRFQIGAQFYHRLNFLVRNKI